MGQDGAVALPPPHHHHHTHACTHAHWYAGQKVVGAVLFCIDLCCTRVIGTMLYMQVAMHFHLMAWHINS